MIQRNSPTFQKRNVSLCKVFKRFQLISPLHPVQGVTPFSAPLQDVQRADQHHHRQRGAPRCAHVHREADAKVGQLSGVGGLGGGRGARGDDAGALHMRDLRACTPASCPRRQSSWLHSLIRFCAAFAAPLCSPSPARPKMGYPKIPIMAMAPPCSSVWGGSMPERQSATSLLLGAGGGGAVQVAHMHVKQPPSSLPTQLCQPPRFTSPRFTCCPCVWSRVNICRSCIEKHTLQSYYF